MNPQPNLAGNLRLGYIVAGAVLILWALSYADPGSGKIFGCIAGAAVLIEGLIAYCPVRALLGAGAKKDGANLPR
jgi:hypothetical protein